MGGETKDELKTAGCMEFIKTSILNQELKDKFDDHILVAWTSELLKDTLKKSFSNSIVHESVRSLYNFNINKGHSHVLTKSDYDVKEIDETLLRSDLVNKEVLVDEITALWGNVDTFHTI